MEAVYQLLRPMAHAIQTFDGERFAALLSCLEQVPLPPAAQACCANSGRAAEIDDAARRRGGKRTRRRQTNETPRRRDASQGSRGADRGAAAGRDVDIPRATQRRSTAADHREEELAGWVRAHGLRGADRGAAAGTCDVAIPRRPTEDRAVGVAQAQRCVGERWGGVA